MEKLSSGDSKREVLILDVSLFALDFLDPNKLIRNTGPDFILLIPGALVEMMERYILYDDPILYKFLLAYLRDIKDRAFPKVNIEVDDERLTSIITANIAELRKLALLAQRRLLHVYAPLIEQFAHKAEFRHEESRYFENDFHPVIRLYNPPIEELYFASPIEKLQNIYRDIIKLSPHYLVDRYFQQILHSRKFGIALSDKKPRSIVELSPISTYIASKWGGKGKHKVSKQKNTRETLSKFINNFPWEGIAKFCYAGAVSIMVAAATEDNFIPVAFVAEYLIGESANAIWKYPGFSQNPWMAKGQIILIMTFIVILVLVYSWRKFKPVRTFVCVPCPSTPTPIVYIHQVTPTAQNVLDSSSSEIDASEKNQSQDNASPSLTPEQSQTINTNEPNYCIYVVQPGDTRKTIASRFSIPESQVGSVVTHQKLLINKSCCFPNEVNGMVYKVGIGDTVYNISRRHFVSVENLSLVNNLYNPNYIQVGQMLCIPNP